MCNVYSHLPCLINRWTHKLSYIITHTTRESHMSSQYITYTNTYAMCCIMVFVSANAHVTSPCCWSLPQRTQHVRFAIRDVPLHITESIYFACELSFYYAHTQHTKFHIARIPFVVFRFIPYMPIPWEHENRVSQSFSMKIHIEALCFSLFFITLITWFVFHTVRNPVFPLRSHRNTKTEP